MARKPPSDPPRKRGRPTLLTPEVQEEICQALKISVPIKHAALAAGVSERDFEHWMEYGRAGKEPFAEFLSAVTRAQSQAVKNLTTITLTGGKGSGGAQFLLERRFREHYGRQERVEMTGANGGPIATANVRDLSDEELAKIASSTE